MQVNSYKAQMIMTTTVYVYHKYANREDVSNTSLWLT
jgi:hypothetical protein